MARPDESSEWQPLGKKCLNCEGHNTESQTKDGVETWRLCLECAWCAVVLSIIS